MDNNLGVYRPRPCGEFVGTANYRYLDIVRYQGSTYININLDTNDGIACIGILPVGQPQSELYWMLIAEKGDKGDTAVLYTEYQEVSNGTWDYSVTDKIFIPEDGSPNLNILNSYNGCCGMILTKLDLLLPSNSLFSVDFDYLDIVYNTDYYFYTFTYMNTGSDSEDVYVWHRSVVRKFNAD